MEAPDSGTLGDAGTPGHGLNLREAFDNAMQKQAPVATNT